ncbi:calmodulin-binding transcription activator 4 isoform X1 [Ipomoea triloba]|uniref:calmodulin-binding transcription activator 4 isoform X1 n=1 Tax=Ipomoea triloba TaxID=35885 RepID=UPI00125D07C2|nr:calmodulin-binding transcription activator 4 isoform X1 [Ipomoea triloba]
MTEAGYNFSDLIREAQGRWLKPAEVLFILQNHENHQIAHEPPQKPGSGSLFLFNKRVLRFFRKDGHSWRRKRDGRTVGEAHERLKVGSAEALNCYYAHGEQNPNFQRRSYWMLDPAYEHIVLVHYRDISETQGRQNAGFMSQFSPVSSTSSQSPSPYSTQYAGSSVVVNESYEPYSSPGSVEISSHAATTSNGISQSSVREGVDEVSSSSAREMSLALRKLEEQLSLNDDSFKEIDPLYNDIDNSDGVQNILDDHRTFTRMPEDSNSLLLQQHSGYLSEHNHQIPGYEVDPWKEALEGDGNYLDSKLYGKYVYTDDKNMLLAREPVETPENMWFNFDGKEAQNHSITIPQQVEDFKYPLYSPAVNTYRTDPIQYTTLFNQGQIGISLEADLGLTIAQKQKFTIKEISPDWGYATAATKVVIIGSFLCDPSESEWVCMFGDVEVPVQIIQEGVIRCQAPPHLPGKVNLCITTGNRESCSEVREFEYRVESTSKINSTVPETQCTNKSPEELLLLIRFGQMLLSDGSNGNFDSSGLGNDYLEKVKAGEDSWSQVIEALLVGSSTTNLTIDWFLQELLKDKLQQWIFSKFQGKTNSSDCMLSRKEQGIIHMVAGLGFEWALHPILNAGVSVNFRDIAGWTALHWAARFGREKMVAALIASGASAGAVTDPTKQDPIGKTPAAIAANCGHKGLAGYLSEVALTSHLSSLTLEESELSKGSADVEAEKTIVSVSTTSATTNEDELSLKHTLAAVRNAAQAAARIQSAFRAHSFRKRQQKEVVSFAAGDEYYTLSNDIQGLSAASKLAFRSTRDYNSAALAIQKKYRGWKGRKDFLTFRQKVVKIQAHVRGYQVRKQYKVCWAVGVLEKVVLRWRRRGVGLRGFRHETDSIDETEDEDILKVFRKQKVDATIDEAVSRVLSMVESPEARQQYHRILEKYRQAKAELQGVETEATSSHDPSISSMENDDIYQYA